MAKPIDPAIRRQAVEMCRAGMSDATVARDLGVSQPSVSKWRWQAHVKPNYAPRFRPRYVDDDVAVAKVKTMCTTPYIETDANGSVVNQCFRTWGRSED